jgi:hypothetical protein
MRSHPLNELLIDKGWDTMPYDKGRSKEVRKMATLFARHKVKNFGEWKAAYDAFDEERKTMGVTGQGAYQSDDNPNDVTIYHHFKSIDAAMAFGEDPRLKEVMERAGVVGPPDIWFVNQV